MTRPAAPAPPPACPARSTSSSSCCAGWPTTNPDLVEDALRTNWASPVAEMREANRRWQAMDARSPRARGGRPRVPSVLGAPETVTAPPDRRPGAARR